MELWRQLLRYKCLTFLFSFFSFLRSLLFSDSKNARWQSLLYYYYFLWLHIIGLGMKLDIGAKAGFFMKMFQVNDTAAYLSQSVTLSLVASS